MATMDFTETQLQEVWSWVHNQDRCVTTQTVSLELGLPRTVAGALLQALPKHNASKEKRTYELTSCCLVEEAPNKSVVKLNKSTVSSNDDDNSSAPLLPEGGTVYSIALASTESVETAHERDMVTLRESLAALDPSLHCYNVTPHQEVQRDGTRSRRVADVTRSINSAASTKMRKTTTAKAFFNDIDRNKNDTKNKESTSAATTKKEDTSKEPESKKRAKKQAPAKQNPFAAAKNAKKKAEEKKKKVSSTMILSDSSSDDEDDDAVEFSQPPPPKKKKSSKADEEKENTNVGNADDFVGDEEEDDEFVAQEEERQKRKAKQQLEQDQAKREREQTLQKRAERSAPEPKQPQEPTERKRKRRKTLVDKTSFDANGYLHTEKVTVWEDIPTDEEEEAEAKAKSLKSAKPMKKNMKQAGLMGFFAKKK